ncbi:exosome complex component RRP45A-like isoform X2 [Andrographis paniculata]|uniref:exosome complex component RRP45A-like isoform X2 n=1 Tax=Andrographis paniculata TaxID=175694 RepID=UPI0021E98838|nr:exosome complex component RRP45A-like isoform X2 [Andrographis paniculata]
MEQRSANTWRMTVNEKKFIETALLSDVRIDGRGPFDYRNVTIQFGSEDGSSEVQLGQTRVMGFVTSQLVQPYRDRPNEGTLAIFTEFSPMADPSFESGRPGEHAVELGRIIDRGLRESQAVDMESLCVFAGKWVWSIRIDLHIIDNGGNLVDAANIAALAALLTFRRPECTLEGEDGQEVKILPPEEREPVPLILHHLPIAVTFAFIGSEIRLVLDPTHFEEAVMGGKLTATLNANGDVCAIQKAGGEGVIQSVIVQCLRIASVKAADITGKIKNAVELYNTGRALRKIERYTDSVDVSAAVWKGDENIQKEMDKLRLETTDGIISQSDGKDIKIHSSEKDATSLADKRPSSSIIGPSSWDPYSRGVNAEELKASLASRVSSTPYTMDVSVSSTPPMKPKDTTMDRPIKDADTITSLPQEPPAAGDVQSITSLPQEPPAAGDVQSKAKTLKDAVKPKSLRKKKTFIK